MLNIIKIKRLHILELCSKSPSWGDPVDGLPHDIHGAKESSLNRAQRLSILFFVFKIVLRFTITVRSDFRSIEVFIYVSLLNLHEVSARAHLFLAISFGRHCSMFEC